MNWIDQEENCAEIERVNIKMIQYGIEPHQRVEGHVKAQYQDKEAIAKETLTEQAKILNQEYMDMNDLDEASTVHVEKGWM